MLGPSFAEGAAGGADLLSSTGGFGAGFRVEGLGFSDLTVTSEELR